MGRKSEKKILLQNSIHTRPGEENSEKTSKKIQKIIKPLPGIICSQYGMGQAEKVKKKNLLQNSVRKRHGQENSEKNSKKILKIIKPIRSIIFNENGMR